MNTRITDNIGLVHHVAKRMHSKRCQVSYSDLVQEGVFGVIEAHKRYNPQKGAFSTYAYFWIRSKMSKAISFQANTIRIPQHQFGQVYHNYTSLDELHDSMPSTISNESSEHDVSQYLQVLTARERAVVRMKCGFLDGIPMSNKDIGNLYGISGEAIRQTYNKAIKKMRMCNIEQTG